MTFGSMTLTHHLASLAVVLFMFLSVSVFLESMSAGRAWPLQGGPVYPCERPRPRQLQLSVFEPQLLRDKLAHQQQHLGGHVSWELLAPAGALGDLPAGAAVCCVLRGSEKSVPGNQCHMVPLS